MERRVVRTCCRGVANLNGLVVKIAKRSKKLLTTAKHSKLLHIAADANDG